VVRPASHRVSRVPWYSRSPTAQEQHCAFVYRALTVCGHAFQQCSTSSGSAPGDCLHSAPGSGSYNPASDVGCKTTESDGGLGSSRFARRYFGNRLFSSRYVRCFSSRGALLPDYGFIRRYHPLMGDGLPHSEIVGSRPGNGSPTLIAAAHVLHRHSTPRHPPHASSSLVVLPVVGISLLLQLASPSAAEHNPPHGDRLSFSEDSSLCLFSC
jgi:hypothetical protein